MPRADEIDAADGAVLAAVVAALPDPVIVTDRAGAVLAFNDPALSAWPGLGKGRPLSLAVRSPEVLGAVDRLQRGERRASAHYAERVPVERIYEVVLSVVEVRTAEGSAPTFLLAFRDRTEQHRLDMMRVDFVANASHELRTPLASLLGFIETLQGPAREDAAARERFLLIMRQQAQRMARLIDDLLSLSRVEMAEHRRPETPVDLAAIAGQMVDTLRPLADEREVVIAFSAPPGGAVVPGDRDDLMRVAENLIENAIKYGQSGGRVDVSVVIEDESPGRPQAVLAVRDYGPGIAPEHVPRLTERFYRVDTGQSRGQGGTGLGLALVKHVVNRHRGRLAIESRPGEGATFRVMLPAGDPVSRA